MLIITVQRIDSGLTATGPAGVTHGADVLVVALDINGGCEKATLRFRTGGCQAGIALVALRVIWHVDAADLCNTIIIGAGQFVAAVRYANVLVEAMRLIPTVQLKITDHG
jgi:hypothetical protein